jgi:hypothetical protein
MAFLEKSTFDVQIQDQVTKPFKSIDVLFKMW